MEKFETPNYAYWKCENLR